MFTLSPARLPRNHLAALACACAVAVTACEEHPTTPDPALQPQASSASMANSNAPFISWHQGFNHGTDGWYGAETAGDIGWCGTIEQVIRGEGTVRPSAGRGYAVVTQGTCNAFYDAIFSAPGATLVNGPWAPGPDLALFSEVWPASGFVMLLDVYLDPSWTPAALAPGTVNYLAPAGTVFTLAASVSELATGALHYFFVPVFPDNGNLSILGHSVDAAGWYTFRFVFGDDGGQLTVDFELAARTGATLFTAPILTRFFTGEPTSDLATAALGSGYLWFAAISPGLELPIDEHQLRKGQ